MHYIYFSAVFCRSNQRTIFLWYLENDGDVDDQSDGPIMSDTGRDDLVGKSSPRSLITVSSLIHPHCTWDERNGTGMGEGCECSAV